MSLLLSFSKKHKKSLACKTRLFKIVSGAFQYFPITANISPTLKASSFSTPLYSNTPVL